jgi:hypothetical protein
MFAKKMKRNIAQAAAAPPTRQRCRVADLPLKGGGEKSVNSSRKP